TLRFSRRWPEETHPIVLGVAEAAAGAFDVLDAGIRGLDSGGGRAGDDEDLDRVPPGHDGVVELSRLGHVRDLDEVARPHPFVPGLGEGVGGQQAAARTALSTDVEKLAHPRRSGDRAALRVLLASRSLTDQQRTANKNALTALLRTTDVGVDARKPLTDAQISTIAAWRTGRDEPSHRIFREEARRLAKAIIEQTRSLQQNHQALSALTEALSPGLQGIPGVGAVTGAILVASYSHHGRVRSEAAFAALGGIAPLPASSGNTSRHRLSRSGDRQLNRAVDVVVRTRMSYDPATCKYV